MKYGSHLSHEELVDHVDGVLPAARAAHLTDCAACRGEAGALSAALHRAAEVSVPEPSPLFWDHLSSRIRGAVADTTPAPSGWHAWPWTPWAAAAAALVLTIALTYSVVAPRLTTSVGPVELQSAAGPTDAIVAMVESQDDAVDDPEADEAWALVRSVAEDTRWDDAHAAGISARPGSADGIVIEMTSAEQSELARMLEEELRQSGI